MCKSSRWKARRERWQQYHEHAGSDPAWAHSGPPWMAAQPGKRRFFFRRFAFLFGGLLLLFLITLGAILAYLLRANGVAPHTPAIFPLLFCGVPILFTLLMGAMGGWAFRRIGLPVADVMAAADAVAEGNLDVRVREDMPGEFARLARSFNRMTAELARAEQQRRSLTADVAHELRTPLHVIQGNLEGILDGVYQPTEEHITATLEETRLLARLVTDLQTLSLAESGQLPLHRTQLNVEDVLQDVLTRFSGQAAAAGVELVMQLPPNASREDTSSEAAPLQAAPLQVEADPDRLDQVLSNLVANALRHTPSGGRIRLGAEPLTLEENGAVKNGVRLTVADTGTGIAPEDLPYIFDRFWRGDPSRTRQEGTGSGLGLAIARQLIEAHGGKISAASTPGQGATFTIDLI